jgi:ribosomal protein S20
MPDHSSPAKAMRRDAVARARNRSQLSELKTYRKKFLESVAGGTPDLELFRKTQSLVARAGRKLLIPKNRASRIISRMMKRMQSVA